MATLKYNAKKLQLLIPNAKRHTVTKFKRDNSEIRPSNIDTVVEAIYKDMEAINSSLGAATTLTALTDTPSDYLGDSNKIAGVVNGETGIEYKNWSIAASNLYPNSSGGTIGKAGNGVGKLYFDNSGELDYQGDLDILSGGSQKAVFKQTTGYLGLGTTTPLEPLHTTGAIVIGNATQSSAGTVRYTAGDYQGHDGTNWVSFIGGSSTAGNGLSKVAGQIELGGTITSDVVITDDRLIPKGVEYKQDYSLYYTDRSFVDKGFVLDRINALAYDDTAIQAAVALNTAKISYNATDSAKLGLIEDLADVTDTANVVAALSAGTGVSISPSGVVDVTAVALTTVNTVANESAQLALLSEEGDVVVRSDENKSYVHNGGSSGTMSDYTLLATPTDAVLSVDGNTGVITAAQIATAVDSAVNSNTFNDSDHLKLDSIEASADVTDAVNVAAAGALMDSEVTDLSGIKGVTISTLQVKPAEGEFNDGDKTKLDNIEPGADVTDTPNVVAALSAGQGVSISAGGSIAVTSLAITEVNTVASEVDQLALIAQEGDVAVRSDENKSYIHNGGSAGTMADYTLLATPNDAVLSVAGNTGVVTSAQIKTAYEGEANAFTDAQFTKLATIEGNAKDDQTGAEIKSLYEVQANAYTDTKNTKLGTIETSADVTDTANVVASLSAGTGITISSGGVVAVSALALVTVQEAANELAQLAFVLQEGDVVVRSDLNKSYVHNGGVSGTMADYTELLTPTDAVLSVNGNTGAITSAQIKAAYEGETSAFTDTQFTKLAGIEDGATADQDLSGYALLTDLADVAYTNVDNSFSANQTFASDVNVGGNLGVGTTNPSEKLEVAGTTRSLDYLAGGSGGSKGYEFSASGSGPGIANMFAPSSFTLGFGTNNTERMRITSAGNVGLGTTAPVAKLHVIGENDFSSDYALRVSNLSGFLLIRARNSGQVGIGNVSPVATLHVKSAPTESPFLVQDSLGSTLMQAKSDGNCFVKNNFGVGTTSPNEKLEISGVSPRIRLASSVSNTVAEETVGAIDFFSNDDSLSAGGVHAKIEGYAADQFGKLGLRFFTGAAGSVNERMRIDNSGNVGIGTTSPSEKLEVLGSARIGGTNYPSLTVSGNLSGILILEDQGAPLDGKTMTLRSDGGSSFFTSLTDDGAVLSSNILHMKHSTGNVGIGTDSPLATFVVQPSTTSFNLGGLANGQIALGNNASSSQAPTFGAKVTSNSQYPIQFITGQPNASTVAGMAFSIREDNNSDFATTANKIGYQFNRFTTPLVTIMRDGNVGIGTDSPSGILHLKSNDSAVLIIQADANNDADDGTKNATLQFGVDGTNNSSSITHYNYSGYSTLSIYDAINIRNNSNVGIGTDDPTATLDVNGTMALTAAPASSTGPGLNLVRNTATGMIETAGSPVQQLKVSLSSAQLSNINTTPVVLIAAQGAGKVTLLHTAMLRCTPATTVESTFATQSMVIGYTLTGPTISSLDTGQAAWGTATELISSAVSTNVVISGADNGVLAISGDDGNFAEFDGTMDVYITYEVITL